MITELKAKHKGWRSQGVVVVLISLDKTPEDFSEFVSGIPFISTNDYEGWNSPVVRDFHVHSLPAMVLLDSDREILLHPDSVQHVNV